MKKLLTKKELINILLKNIWALWIFWEMKNLYNEFCNNGETNGKEFKTIDSNKHNMFDTIENVKSSLFDKLCLNNYDNIWDLYDIEIEPLIHIKNKIPIIIIKKE